MSKKKGNQKKNVEIDADDFDFLVEEAKHVQKNKENEIKKLLFDDSTFSNLPESPLKLNTDRKFEQRYVIPYTDEQKKLWYVDSEAEKRLNEWEETIMDFREAGIIHQAVREWAVDNVIKPGVNLNDMCGKIEEAVRRMVCFEPPVRGLAFPCGCSINNCAAHYSPLPGDKVVLGKHDVMKIDFGVAINGHIIDAAFTTCFDDKFRPLIEASKEATDVAIKLAGPDARIAEISAAIEEVITSYSIELNGKVLPIRPVSNLQGHQLGPYKVHCGKSIPIVKNSHSDEKMEPGEIFACETFATTGQGYVTDDGVTSHFMLNQHNNQTVKGSEKELLKIIQDNFKTLAFCQRFIQRTGTISFSETLMQLVKKNFVSPYPPLSDVPGSYVSQHEHTFAIFEHHKEVFSRD